MLLLLLEICISKALEDFREFSVDFVVKWITRLKEKLQHDDDEKEDEEIQEIFDVDKPKNR
jgi:hypothetical protein